MLGYTVASNINKIISDITPLNCTLHAIKLHDFTSTEDLYIKKPAAYNTKQPS